VGAPDTERKVRKLIQRAHVDDGQALVELAFVLPILLLILFGIIDFGLALNNQNQDTNVANIAVREAAVVGTTTYAMCGTTTEASINAWAQCESTQMGGPAVSVCVADVAGASPSGTYTTGDPVKVEVTSNFAWLKLITGKVGNLSSTIGGDATMRVEGTLTGSNTFLSPTCSS
jgi:Flp pilus assembly protein TadG